MGKLGSSCELSLSDFSGLQYRGGKMRNMFRTRVLSAAVMGFTMLGMLVSPVSAAVIVGGMDNYFLPGADALGNSSAAQGGFGPAKVFKYTNINLLVGVSHAFVYNLSNRVQVYRNQGAPITDPQTLIVYVADSDVEVIGRPSGATQALAVGVATKRVP